VKSLEDVLVEVEGREDEDPRGHAVADEPARRRDPVERGHANVHQGNVGPQASDCGDRLLAVRGLADDLDVVLTLEQGAKAGANHPLIIGDNDADRHDDAASRNGRRAHTRKPPPGRSPVSSAPP
jgi:hypothetical protein